MSSQIVTGSIVKAMEYPHTDDSFFVGEVMRLSESRLHCRTLQRVRHGNPVPLSILNEEFSCALPGYDPKHDRRRSSEGRDERVQILIEPMNLQVWSPNDVA